MMPTRYTLDVDLKGVVSAEVVDNSSKKVDANKVGWECSLVERQVRLMLHLQHPLLGHEVNVLTAAPPAACSPFAVTCMDL